MSLDVSLYGEPRIVETICHACGHSHEEQQREEFYTANITHNLNDMAEFAGLYKPLWMPEEIGITTAKELIPHLERGLLALKDNPAKFKVLNPRNGWGNYEILVEFTEHYLAACKEFPDATVEVSR